MSRVDVSHIRSLLRAEVPEFQLSRTAGAFLGTLLTFLLSVCLSAFVGVVLAWFITAVLEISEPEIVLVTGGILAPLLGLAIGYASRDSLASPGSALVENAMKRETSTWGIGYDREDQTNDMFAGCVIFLLQTLAGSVYASAAQLAQIARPSHEGEFELAVSIVNYLLMEGRTPTEKMAEALENQGVARDRLASTLSLLRKAGLLEPTPDSLNIAPHKRAAFGHS